MPDWVIDAGVLLVFGFMIFNGILMLVAPAKHRRFLVWFGRTDSWSQPLPEKPGKGLEIQRRLAGIGLAAIGIYVASHVISGIASREGRSSPSSMLPIVGSQSLPLILGACLLAFGVFITVKPQWLVSWSVEHQPIPARVLDTTLAIWKVGARLLGSLFVLGGLYTLWIALRH